MTITFTALPSYGTSSTRQPKVKAVRFGDGYEQRIQDGINSDKQVWSLQFTNRDSADIDSIESDLASLKGVDYFLWTPPRSSTQGKYICRSWQRQIAVGTTDSLTATFEQVYDL